MTLVVLIVCAGYFATKVNNPWYAMGDEAGKNVSSIKPGDTAKGDFFTESRMTREQSKNESIQTLQTLINNPNAAKDKKDEATKKTMEITTASDKQTKIENLIKGKGYDDALCYVEDDKVRVFVKIKDKLTSNDMSTITAITMDVSKIKNIEVEGKQ